MSAVTVDEPDVLVKAVVRHLGRLEARARADLAGQSSRTLPWGDLARDDENGRERIARALAMFDEAAV